MTRPSLPLSFASPAVFGGNTNEGGSAELSEKAFFGFSLAVGRFSGAAIGASRAGMPC